ncbi:unnamed protein product, partial [Effrenium voratum]
APAPAGAGRACRAERSTAPAAPWRTAPSQCRRAPWPARRPPSAAGRGSSGNPT